jgi:hypothetical protein
MAQGNLFNHIPNNEEGELFLSLLRKYANRNPFPLQKRTWKRIFYSYQTF